MKLSLYPNQHNYNLHPLITIQQTVRQVPQVPQNNIHTPYKFTTDTARTGDRRFDERIEIKILFNAIL